VHHLRRRRADTGLLVLLGGVERAPLRPTVDLVLVDDETTVLTDRLALGGVSGEVATALRADEFVGRLGLGLVRFLVIPLEASDTRVCHCGDSSDVELPSEAPYVLSRWAPADLKYGGSSPVSSSVEAE